MGIDKTIKIPQIIYPKKKVYGENLTCVSQLPAPGKCMGNAEYASLTKNIDDKEMKNHL